ncbi:PKS-NRPS hybrid synthetase cheA [Linum grandiflorum]
MKQIYNALSKFRAEERGGRNHAQRMFDLAVEHKYVYYFDQTDDSNSLTHIFMAHPEAVNLYRAYHYVVCMDSTYKTNRYGYPLVELIGVTPVGKSFTIAYVLMKDESTESYTWVLERLKTLLDEDLVPGVIVTDRELGLLAAIPLVFPDSAHLLCVWHIYSAVEAKATNIVRDEKLGKNVSHRWWNDVLEASTHAEFLKGWVDFQAKWPGMVNYLRSTWIPHCDKFVRCYTNQVLHLGNTATSRVESAHAILKAWLGNSTLALDTIWKRTHALIEGQHVDIRKLLEASCGELILTTHRPLFSYLTGRVAKRAIILMDGEYKRGMSLGAGLDESCGCVIVTTHGLLCACRLHNLKRQNRRVHLEDVHLFWRTLHYTQGAPIPQSDFDRLNSLFDEIRASNPSLRRDMFETIYRRMHPEDEDLEEPVINETRKGRPKKSTSRNPSGVEHARRKYHTPNKSTKSKRHGKTSSHNTSASTQNETTSSTINLEAGKTLVYINIDGILYVYGNY